MRFIGIEAGGSKFVCAVGDEAGKLSNIEMIPTDVPELTLSKVLAYISKQNKKSIDAIGLASFGPIQRNLSAPQYGFITNSPKKHWQNIDIVGELQKSFDGPIAFDTDVNAAALAEFRFGVAQHHEHFIYVTVGTGIGCGAMVKGKLLHGAHHPEMGHLLIPHDLQLDNFSGICPYHRNCLEGLASVPAINKRWSVASPETLPEEHKAWDLQAHYLAVACANYTMVLAPQKIILGGGLMQQKHLFAKIHAKFKNLLNGYFSQPILEATANYIVPANLGKHAGVIGAVALAQQNYWRVKDKSPSSPLNEIGKDYEKPWGAYKVLSQEPGFQLKLLTVKPNSSLSLQTHSQRSEHWVVIEGAPTLTMNDTRKTYQVNDTLYIPLGATHRIENHTNTLVKIIELQLGSYLGEDDIIRLEDTYGRI